MPRLKKDDDLVSTVSIISSSVYFGEEQGDEEEEYAEREMKYVPPPPVIVKTEILEEDEDEDDYEPPEMDEDDEEWNVQNKRRKSSPRKSRGVIKEANSSGTTRSKTASVVKGKRRRQPPMTSEEKKEKARERMRLRREREKEKREQQSLKEAGVKKREGESGRRKKGISEMAGEEAESARAQWLEERKEGRQRERQLKDARVKNERVSEEEDGDDNNDEDYKPDKERTSGASKKSAGVGGGRRRKRVSEMTEEEKEFWRARWKAQSQRKRERAKQLPPEEKQEHLKRTKRKRTLRDAVTEEQKLRIEEQYRKDRERKRLRRAALTPQQRREESQKTSMYRIARQAKMSEDELKMKKMEKYFQDLARRASLTPEQLEMRRQKRREGARKQWQRVKETPGGMERWNEQQREYRNNMSLERKRRHAERMRENYRKRYAAVKEDPEKMEKIKEQWKKSAQSRRERRQQRFECEGSLYTKSAQDQINNRRRRRMEGDGCPHAGVAWKDMTVDQQRERRRWWARRGVVEKKLKIQQMLDSGMSMEDIQEQVEPPEMRHKRLIALRIRKHKRKLRARLRACGVGEEEIEQQVREWVESYQPIMQFRPYKALPDRWKRVDPSEIKMLKAGGLELEELNPIPVSSAVPVKNMPNPITSNQETSVIITLTPPPPTPPRKRGRPIIKSQNLATTQHQQQEIYGQQQVQHSSSAHIGGGGVVYLQPYQLTHSQHHHSPGSEYQTISVYPIQQQPQSQHPLVTQTYSLQTLLDGISLQESGGVLIGHQITPSHFAAPHTESTTDYASSYGGDETGNNYSSAPASPPEGDKYHDDEYDDSPLPKCDNNPCQTQLAPTSSSSSPSKKRRNRKPHEPRPGARHRTKRSEVIRDVICDGCGEYFNRVYLNQHKVYAHNPNFDFKNKICLVCNVKYVKANEWYAHYLRDHVPKVAADKPDMCPECGKTFKSKDYLRKHQYFMHGDGTKKENWHRCPICPREKLFKEFSTLQMHMKRSHPSKRCSVTTGKHLCSRCDGDFINERELREHVRTSHPHDYFPCEVCNAVKFTQLGLNFHYGRCAKVTKEMRDQIVGKWEKEGKGAFSMERMPIRCQFCEKSVNMSSLKRHYIDMHGVNEDKKFACPDCPKEYIKRPFLAAHMEEVHCKKFADMEKHLRQLHANNTKNLRVKARPEKERKKGGGRKKKIGVKSCSSGGEEGEAVLEMKSYGGDEKWVRKGGRMRRPRRNIMVVCEEENEVVKEITEQQIKIVT